MNKFLIILFFVFFPVVVRAQLSTIGALGDLMKLPVSNFGGVVLFTAPCTCPFFPGTLVYVMDPRLISLEDVGKLTEINDAETLSESGMESLVKKVKVVPFVFSRVNLNYSFVPGNYVLGTYFSVSTISAAANVMKKIPLFNTMLQNSSLDFVSGCYVYYASGCAPIVGGGSEGVVTPFVFSGMGTSRIPISL